MSNVSSVLRCVGCQLVSFTTRQHMDYLMLESDFFPKQLWNLFMVCFNCLTAYQLLPRNVMLTFDSLGLVWFIYLRAYQLHPGYITPIFYSFGLFCFDFYVKWHITSSWVIQYQNLIHLVWLSLVLFICLTASQILLGYLMTTFEFFGLVWFILAYLMAYQILLGYLMPISYLFGLVLFG